MKAAILHKVHEPLTIEDLDAPVIAENEVLVRVAACGVCHTDLKVIEGRIPFKTPVLIGHEVSGTVAEVGAGQRGLFKPDDRVIVGMRYRCGQCQACRSGRENLCRSRPAPSSLKKKDGTLVHRWNVGGFSQLLAVPGYMLFAIPPELSLEEASLVGCRMTTAYNAVKHAGDLEPGDSALVIGCGGIGLNTIQFLRCFGAYPIIAVDILDTKLEAAKKFGATHTINASREDPVKTAREITEGGVSKTFEALGNTKTADQIIRDAPRWDGGHYRRSRKSSFYDQRRQFHHGRNQDRRRREPQSPGRGRGDLHGSRQEDRGVVSHLQAILVRAD
jgi:Zn-dependent alcohol dehydrogenase